MAKKKVKETFWCKFKKAFFYDDKKKYFSRTAMMNFVFFMLAVIVTIIGVVLGMQGIALPDNLLVYIGGLCGSGFLQYSYGKKLKNGK